MQKLLRPALNHLRPYVPGRAGPPADPGGVMLASNENPRGPSPRAVQAIAEALGGIHRYPDFSAQELRERLARRWHLTSEHVLVGNGSGLIIAAAARALINPGDEGAVMTPSFSSYQQAIATMGGRVRELPLQDDQFLSVREILAGLTCWTKLLYLCNPNNPTGTTLPPTLWDELFDHLPPTVVVVVDEAYADYASPSAFASAIPWVNDQRPLIVLRTFSKVYGLAGLRIGYAVGPPVLIEAIGRVFEPFAVNALAEVAARAALEDEDYVRESVALNGAERTRLTQALQAMDCEVVPSQANFLFVRFHRPVLSIVEALFAERIWIRPGTQWRRNFHARITIGTREENDRLIDALSRILPG